MLKVNQLLLSADTDCQASTLARLRDSQIVLGFGDAHRHDAVWKGLQSSTSAQHYAGCTTAGLAGLLLAPTVRIEPMMGLDYLVRSFFALVTGGLGSLEGLGIGATLIAGTQSVLGALVNQTSGYLAVLTLSILFLWLKPDGIRPYSR